MTFNILVLQSSMLQSFDILNTEVMIINEYNHNFIRTPPNTVKSHILDKSGSQ